MLQSVQTVFASAARTSTPTAVILDTDSATHICLVIDVSAESDTPSVVFDIDFYDSIGDTYTTLLASAAVATVSVVILKVGPGLTAVTNLVAEALLPGQLRVTATHGDADSITYTVAAYLYKN